MLGSLRFLFVASCVLVFSVKQNEERHVSLCSVG